ncbi:PAS domain S-box protein, partial [bacterium]|nr:PAS domain S-box protein [bacterium]
MIRLMGLITREKSAKFALTILLLAALFWVDKWNSLLFHALIELFAIVVACGIFIVAWNSRRFLKNHYLLYIGIAYLFVAALDLLHALAFKGMGVFPQRSADLPTQIWVAARFTESISLALAALFFRRTFRVRLVFGAYAVVFILLLLSVFRWDIFPTCLVEEGEVFRGATDFRGLTPFKITSEYLICIILAIALLALYRHRHIFDRGIYRLIAASILFTIGSELCFTRYIGVNDFPNQAGHFLKLISFYFMYKAIIETGLRQPYDLLFHDLQDSEASLQLSERKFVKAFRSSPTALAVSSLSSGRIVECNRRFLDMCAVSREEADTETVWRDIWAVPHEADRFRELLLEQGEVRDMEIALKGRDGHGRTSLISAELIDIEMQPHVLSILVDISERKNMEERLRQSHLELEERVRERTEELARANSSLQAEVHQHKETAEALRKRTYDLNERVKEIRLLFTVHEIIEDKNERLDRQIQQIADAMPDGFQHPDRCGARIILHDQTYLSPTFAESRWRLREEISVDDATIGSIEVCLSKGPPEAEKPFFEEERALLSAIALQIGENIKHRQTQEAVAENEELLRTTLNLLPVAVWIADENRNFVLNNPAAEEIWGGSRFTNDEEHREHKGWWADTGQPLRDDEWALARAFRTGEASVNEFIEIEAFDGSRKMILNSVMPIKDEKNCVRGAVVVNQDISHRVQAEMEIRKLNEELEARVRQRTVQLETANRDLHVEIAERKRTEQARERLVAILEATPDMVSTADVDGRILYLNQAGRQILGLTPEGEIDHFTVPDFHPPWAAELILKEGIPTALEKGVWKHETALRDRDGNEIPTLQIIIAHKAPQGRVDYMSTTVHDISEQKRAERALRESEHRYRAMGDSIPYGVWLTSPEGEIEYVSPSFSELLGMSLDEMRDWGWTRRLVPLDVEPMLARWKHCLSTGQVWEWEHRIPDQDGNIRIILSRGRPVRNDEGNIISWAGINLDITLRKEVENALQASEERYRRLAETSTFGLLVGDLHGRVSYINQNLLKMLGYTQEEVERGDINWTKLTPEQYADKDRTAIQQLRSQGACDPYEKAYLAKNGRHVPILTGASVLDELPDGNIQMAVFVTDLTELD